MRSQHCGGITGGHEALSSLTPQQIEFPASSRRLRDFIGMQWVRAASGGEPSHGPACHGRGRPRHLVNVTGEQHRNAMLDGGKMQPPRHGQRRASRINHNTACRPTGNGSLGHPPASCRIGRIDKERHPRKIDTTGMAKPRQRRKIRPRAAAHPRDRIGGSGPTTAAANTPHNRSPRRHDSSSQSRQQPKRRPGIA